MADLRPIQFFMAQNLDLASGTAEFFETGTTTPKEVFDKDGGSEGTSVSLDSAGRKAVFTSGITKVVTKDSDSNVVDTFDAVPFGFGGFPDGWVLDVASVYGSFDDVAIASAISDTGSDKITMLLKRKTGGGAWSINASLTFNVNTRLIIPSGTRLSAGSGNVFLINHPDNDISNDLHFEGSGTFRLPNARIVHSEWWGALGDGTDDATALNAALTSTHGLPIRVVKLHARNYGFVATLNVPTDCILIGEGSEFTSLTRLTGASGICIEGNSDSQSIQLKGFTLDCDFKGTNGIDLGNTGGVWDVNGKIEDVNVTDCAGINFNLNGGQGAVFKDITAFNTNAGGVGTHQINLNGSNILGYNIRILGETGTTANIEFTGSDHHLFGVYIEDPHLTKSVRYTGDNNSITGINIVTEDDTLTYDQLLYFETNAIENVAHNVHINKGASDTVTNSVQDDENSNTVTFATSFHRYDQTGHDHSDSANGGLITFMSQAKVGTFSRDITTASGNQAVTGVGFTPIAILFFGVVGGPSDETCHGFDDGSNGQCLSNENSVSGSTWDDAAKSIQVNQGAGNIYSGDVGSFDADGFTIAWVKTATPTGTLVVSYLAIG